MENMLVCSDLVFKTVLEELKFLRPCFGLYLHPESSLSRKYNYEGDQGILSND